MKLWVFIQSGFDDEIKNQNLICILFPQESVIKAANYQQNGQIY